MLLDSAYYYGSSRRREYESIDVAPSGQILFVISAGHYKLLSLDSFYTEHGTRSDYQIIYVKSGIFYYDENGVQKQANAGSFVFYKPGDNQSYFYYLKDHPDIFWVHFSGTSANVLLQSNNLLESRVVTIQPKQRLEDLFHFMISNLRAGDEYSTQLNTLYLQELVLSIAKERKTTTTKENPEYLKAIKYINNHLSEKITLADIAEYTNVSTKTLTRHFEKNQGMTPMKYVNFLRIERAKILLQSNNPVGQIASALGFDDPLYFSTVFRRFTGLSPEKYRKTL